MQNRDSLQLEHEDLFNYTVHYHNERLSSVRLHQAQLHLHWALWHRWGSLLGMKHKSLKKSPQQSAGTRPRPAVLAFGFAREETDEPLLDPNASPRRRSFFQQQRQEALLATERAPPCSARGWGGGLQSAHLAHLTLRLPACVITISEWDQKKECVM